MDIVAQRLACFFIVSIVALLFAFFHFIGKIFRKNKGKDEDKQKRKLEKKHRGKKIDSFLDDDDYENDDDDDDCYDDDD